jgi:hypothetical protein
MMKPYERMMAAIAGTCQHPPVVVPYLQYYFPEVVDQLTEYTRDDLLNGNTGPKVEALTELHTYFDCDWVRVTTNPVRMSRLYDVIGRGPELVTAEQLLEQGYYDVAKELTRRFKGEKFVYGRVGIPYGALFGDWSDIEGAMVALKRAPERCIALIEASIPQRLEEIRAWAEVGVHGLWLGQWMCSNDMISEADYLRFVYPYDKIIIDAVHEAGMMSIYHFCGDVIPRLKHLKKLAPTVFGVEESKKGFSVEVGEVRAGMGPGMCLLGNIDVYDIVERGTPEAWAHEVERQIRAAGPARFIVSCGSPITHDTPPQQVREFIQTAKSVRDGMPYQRKTSYA